ncbi:hypothetical protein HYZ70_03830 [Candidatus Curtissbacteria bacterium]|nr:hypothetical protein [Candidatus Curtissbacteria bacterium]
MERRRDSLDTKFEVPPRLTASIKKLAKEHHVSETQVMRDLIRTGLIIDESIKAGNPVYHQKKSGERIIFTLQKPPFNFSFGSPPKTFIDLPVVLSEDFKKRAQRNGMDVDRLFESVLATGLIAYQITLKPHEALIIRYRGAEASVTVDFK